MHIQQSIQRPTGANVFGSFVIRVAPDFALLHLSVNRLADSPSEAFRMAREAAVAVRGFLRDEGLADADVQASRITLTTVHKHVAGTAELVGHRASVEFCVSLSELDRLEPLLVGMVEHGADNVRAVTFQTRRLRELRAQARAKAVEAARSKAEVYCQAASVTLGKVIHIEDVNPDQTNRRGYGHAVDQDLAEPDENAEAGAYDPGAIRVAAAVMVGFGLL
jgi:uncharacterized protein YggE